MSSPLSSESSGQSSRDASDQSFVWEVRRFLKATSPDDFALAVQIRVAVFMEEQAVPEDLELDEFDEEAVHWLLLHPGSGLPVATGRMLSYQEACQARPVAKIGRIAVSQSLRGQRVGERLMREILAFVQAEGFEQAILDAQTRVLPFYEKLGFVREGFEFMDANIPHYRMRLVF